MQRRVLLVINPMAGRMRSRTGLFEIVRTLNAAGVQTTVHITSARGEAVRVVEEAGGFDAVISCGGDGTLNEVITGALHSGRGGSLPIGYIPAGTANDLAESLGLSRNLVKATADILSGKAEGHDIGLMNESLYFSYVASFGAFTKVSYATPQPAKNAIGYLAYFFEGIRSVADIQPVKMHVRCDELETEGDFILGAVTNSTSIGGLLKLNPKTVDLGDGIFEVLLIRNPQNASELRNIINCLTHQQSDDHNTMLFHTSSISFTSEKPLEWTVDGEFGGEHRRVEIENLKQAVQIIRPIKKTL